MRKSYAAIAVIFCMIAGALMGYHTSKELSKNTMTVLIKSRDNPVSIDCSTTDLKQLSQRAVDSAESAAYTAAQAAQSARMAADAAKVILDKANVASSDASKAAGDAARQVFDKTELNRVEQAKGK